MPTHKQTTVEPATTEWSKGSSSTANLQGAFPGSPVHNGDLTNDSITDLGNALLLDTIVNDGGHTFGETSRDYTDSPALADVETGGAGLPGGPYTPNTASPGEGSMNASDIPEGPAPVAAGAEFGSGVGHALEPSASSAAISGHEIGDLSMGKSPGS